MSISDAIFQAQCQIDYLANAVDDGGKIVAYDPEKGVITVWLYDDSEQTIYTDPLIELIDRLKSFPTTVPEEG